MSNFNKVILLGRLTRDAEVRYLPSGTAVCDFGMAVNTSIGKDKDEEVLFIDITAFGRTAEVVGEYCSKGTLLLVEGRLKLDVWTDKENNTRSKIKVVTDRVQLMPRNNGKDKQEAEQTIEEPEQTNEPQPKKKVPF